MRIAFFGLGAMGTPMARRLADTGHAVAPFDVNAGALARWRAAGAGPSFSVADAAVVVTCVTDEGALTSLAPDLLRSLPREALWIDHTTASAVTAERLARACARIGAGFVDAPVSGGPEGAAEGRLVAMAGGTPADVERARPLLAAYAAHVVHLGPAGSGQLAKAANQLAIAGTVRGLAEAVALARSGGLDVNALLEALAGGTAASRQLERTRAQWLADEPFEHAFAWLAKDLALALHEAERLRTELPASACIAQLLASR
jgi:3-hydroxyisobutyrate dehydrogenase-like beta-hydroxyacid dehydrogenase